MVSPCSCYWFGGFHHFSLGRWWGIREEAQSTTAAKTNELPDSSRDYHIIAPLPCIDLYALHFNKALTQDATWSHMLNGLFFQLENNLDCSFGLRFVSRNQNCPKIYILIISDMGHFDIFFFSLPRTAERWLSVHSAEEKTTPTFNVRSHGSFCWGGGYVLVHL